MAVVAAVLLASCGNGKTVAAAPKPRTPAVTKTSSAPPRTTSGARPAQVKLQRLPGGTECVVSYRGAFVIFKSSNYDVSPACQAQIQAGAAKGQHWTYPTGGQVSGNAPVCTLTTPMAMATIYDTADNIGHGVCTSLISAGWSQE